MRLLLPPRLRECRHRRLARRLVAVRRAPDARRSEGECRDYKARQTRIAPTHKTAIREPVNSQPRDKYDNLRRHGLL